MSWATASGGGTRLTLRVQPRASRTEVMGPHGDALRVRLAAPPVDGAANEELVRFLADRLRVARTAISLRVGAGGRSKTVHVTGLAPAEVMRRLELAR